MSAVDSQKYIARRVRGHDYDRYFATLFCPAARRPALLALYAFNLEIATIRETVSEPLIGRMRLQWWRDAIGAVYDGRPPGHPVAAALAEITASYELTRAPFDRMIDGRELGLSDAPPHDLAALEGYVEATSSSLVGLALAVLGPNDADTEIARHAGLAWGLAGFLRAIPFRAAQRREIPFGGTPHEVATAAQRHLEAARRIQTGLPRAALGAILPVVNVPPYLALLSRAGGDPFARRLEPSRLTRQWRMTMAAMRARI